MRGDACIGCATWFLLHLWVESYEVELGSRPERRSVCAPGVRAFSATALHNDGKDEELHTEDMGQPTGRGSAGRTPYDI